jgi:opine dehydrogenase
MQAHLRLKAFLEAFMHVGIIGAGSGGLALGGMLYHRGFKVSIWNRSPERVRPILENGNSITVQDVDSTYSARFESVTSGEVPILPDVDIVFVVTPSVAHEELGSKLPAAIGDGVPIVLMPGRTYGSYVFLKEAKRVFPHKNVICLEAQTILHACRSSGASVKVYGTKTKVKYSSVQSIPASIISLLSSVLNELEYVNSYFEVALNNVGAFFHPIPTILNSGWIESGNTFKYYIEGISPRIAEYIQTLDDEKKLICDKMNVRHISLIDWVGAEYGAFGGTLYQCIQNVPAYTDISSPATLDHRYVYDDLKTGLVPIYKTAKYFSINVPTLEAFLNFSCSFLKRDYISEGRDFPFEYYKDTIK